ncbi:hypothetical protein FHX52_2726 [Humibacillus xanthopallidus]|uniref:Uncharacterized protein n=1 Tax=Humibacillus xanthopallidus TaxID=412689 RepID=A0A543PPL8_9MICO|nr:hypothetical protein FHX52_2726 [Humibacillus xanthopallidus]
MSSANQFQDGWINPRVETAPPAHSTEHGQFFSARAAVVCSPRQSLVGR